VEGITTLHLCEPGQGPKGSTMIASSGGGFRLPATDAETWWPSGPEPEGDLGTMLLVKALPAVVWPCLRIVAFGHGTSTITITVTADGSPAPLSSQRLDIEFTPALLGRGPGNLWQVSRLQRITIEEPGLYWIAASLGGAAPVKLPLFIDRMPDFLADWQALQPPRPRPAK
jgi:hypothetical protein